MATTTTERISVQRGHFDEIEGLRGLAALSVFFTHVGATKYAAGRSVKGFDIFVRAVFDELTIGVAIFFAISGFVLYRPFAVRASAGEPPPNLGAYLARRMARIYPAYWCALLGCVFVIGGTRIKGVYYGNYMTGGWRWFANLTLIQGYSTDFRFHNPVGFQGLIQAWTLVVEVSFYLTLPVIALMFRSSDPSRVPNRSPRSAQWRGIILLSILCAVGQLWVAWWDAPEWARVLPASMPMFVSGMILAVAMTSPGGPRRLNSIAARTWWVAAGIAVLLGLLIFFNATEDRVSYLGVDVVRPWPAEWMVRLAITLLISWGMVLVAVVSPPEHHIRRFLRSRLAVWIGTVSYGVYLWHTSIIYWISIHWFEPTKSFTVLSITATALPASLAMAWISLRLIERPAQRLAKRIGRNPSAIPR